MISSFIQLAFDLFVCARREHRRRTASNNTNMQVVAKRYGNVSLRGENGIISILNHNRVV